MYLNYYGLNKQPFSISPDPDFIWFSERHGEAFSTLKYGIEEDKGFLVLTGDIGTGKTLLIKNLEKKIPIPAIIVTVPDPDMKPLEFYRFLAEEIQMNKKFKTKGEFLIHFKNFLLQAFGAQKKVLLIIDEAQRLNHRLLEEIRLLSNLEMTNRKLLNIFFVGQNEFAEMLDDDRSKAVRQRITVGYHLDSLTEEETTLYIEHRLKVAGATKQIFSNDAIQEIYNFSNGYPRVINILCDNALRYGCRKELPLLSAGIISEIAKDLPIPKALKAEIGDKEIEPQIENEVALFEAEAAEEEGENETGPQLEDEVELSKAAATDEEEKNEIAPKIEDEAILFKEAVTDEIEEKLSPFTEEQTSSQHEVDKAKELIIRKPSKIEKTHKPRTSLKYAAIAIFIFVFGVSGYLFYNSYFSNNSRWSLEEIAPKKEFKISENKKLALEQKESKKPILQDKNPIPQETLKDVEAGESLKSNKLIAKKVEPKSQQEELIPKTIAEETITKKDTNDIPAAKIPDSAKAAEPKSQQEELISKTTAEEAITKKDMNDISSADIPPKKHTAPFSSDAKPFLKKIIIYFPFNSFVLPEHAPSALNQIVEFASKHPDLEITVEGYTDALGNYWYNQKLSQTRADAIKDYFVEQGIIPSRISARGLGPEDPIDSNETPEGRQRNRRVEIKLNL